MTNIPARAQAPAPQQRPVEPAPAQARGLSLLNGIPPEAIDPNPKRNVFDGFRRIAENDRKMKSPEGQVQAAAQGQKNKLDAMGPGPRQVASRAKQQIMAQQPARMDSRNVPMGELDRIRAQTGNTAGIPKFVSSLGQTQRKPR